VKSKFNSMKKVIIYDSPESKLKIINPHEKTNKLPNKCFSSVNGFLSFYLLKSYSRTPILENISVNGALKEDGTFMIYFNEKEFINIPYEIKENLKCNYGLGSILFSNTLFFKGSLMDGFDYDHLSEKTSTFIVNGDMVSFKKASRTSSIGKLKRIDDIIYLNSNVTVKCKNEEFRKKRKYLNSNLGINISMEFKKGAA